MAAAEEDGLSLDSEMVSHHVSGSHVSGPARNSRCFGFAARRFAALAGAMVLRLSLLVPNNITAIVLVACCVAQERIASAMNATDFIVPIMLGVLFALLLALAFWPFVDLPLFLPDEG